MNLADQLRGYSAYSAGGIPPYNANDTILSAGSGTSPAGGLGVPGATATTGAPPIQAGGQGIGALGVANLAVGGLQALGNLWLGFKAQKLAKKQFEFQKNFGETNLRNSIQDYNTRLEDQHRSRAFTEGRSAASGQAEYKRRALPDYKPGG